MAEPRASASSTLGAAATEAEGGFLATGQSLESAVGILSRLSRRFANYTAELTGDTLDETRRELSSAAAHIAELVDVRSSDAASLGELREIIAAIRGRIATLLPVTHEVATLSVSARIVAGGMGLAATDFAVFAQNILQAAQHARQCLTEARQTLSLVDQELAAARTDAATFAQRHSQAMQAIPARIAGNLSSLAAQQLLAAEAATTAQSQSELVRQQVAEQIVALQLGDVVRQRVEHVEAATQYLAGPCRQVGALLAAQLNDTAADLTRESERIETGLRRLALAARAIGQLGVQLHGASATQRGGFVAALEADIRQTAALFTAMSADDGVTDRRMAGFLVAADALATRLASVQSVQEDIRIMSLNATLKCSRLGPVGRPLAAVAQELRLCSGSFGAGAAAILHDLERLRPIAASLRDPARCAKHAVLARTADDMLAPLQRLDRLQQELTAALSGLQNDADEVGHLVDNAVSRFGVRHGLVTTLRQVASELAAQTATHEPEHEASSRDVLDQIAAGYTMDRERAVHVRFAPLPRAAAPAELDDVLF